MEIEERLKKLQDDLSLIDLFSNQKNKKDCIEFLVKKLQDLEIRMYQEKNHNLPHIHIDYGKEKHAATYSLDKGLRLAGNLSQKYDKTIQEWINQNKTILIEMWKNNQNGNDVKELIRKIKGI